MKAALAIVAVTVAGCATVTPEQVIHAARSSSNYELCEALVTSNQRWTGIISAEIERRSLDCRQYASTIQLKLQQRQAQSKAMQDAANYFRPPPTVNCTTIGIGRGDSITSCR